MSEVGVAEAARSLRLTPSRVRAMASRGRLPARFVAGRWLIDAGAVDNPVHRPSGRPFSPSTAWAVADLLDGGIGAWLPPNARYAIRKRLEGNRSNADPDWWVARLRHRSRKLYLRSVSPITVAAIESLSEVKAGGLAASHTHGTGLGRGPVMDLYTTSGQFGVVEKELLLLPSDRPNVIAHIVENDYLSRLGPSDIADRLRVVPRLIAAIDLLEAGEPRARSAGFELLTRTLADTDGA